MKHFFLLIFLAVVSITVFCQTADELADQAEKDFVAGKYQSAVKLYTKAIQKDIGNIWLYIHRAEAYIELNKIEDAFNDYKLAISLEPKNPLPYLHRGTLYYRLNKPDMAIKETNKALDLAADVDSLHFGIYINRGNAWALKRDFDRAYEDFMLAYQIDSLDKAILTNLGALLDETGRDGEAIYYLKKVIDLYPDFIGGYINLAFRYTEKGKYVESIELNDKVIEMDPKMPYAYNNRGYSKYKMRDFSGALKDINKSLDLYPQNSFAYKNRALVYLETGETEKACKDLQKALQLQFTSMYGSEVENLVKQYCH